MKVTDILTLAVIIPEREIFYRQVYGSYRIMVLNSNPAINILPDC